MDSGTVLFNTFDSNEDIWPKVTAGSPCWVVSIGVAKVLRMNSGGILSTVVVKADKKRAGITSNSISECVLMGCIMMLKIQ